MPDSSSLQSEDCAYLVQQTRHRDKEAYNQLYALHGLSLWRFLTKLLLGDVEEARNLTQATFIKGWHNIENLQDDYCFKSWLYTIAFNLARTFLRQREPKRWVVWEEYERVLATREEQETLASLADSVVGSELLKIALDHVTPIYRACVLLWLEDVPHKDIAALLGIEVDKVSTNIASGKEQLRRVYLYLEEERQAWKKEISLSQQKEDI